MSFDEVEAGREGAVHWFGRDFEADPDVCVNCGHDSLSHVHLADSTRSWPHYGSCVHGSCSCVTYTPKEAGDDDAA